MDTTFTVGNNGSVTVTGSGGSENNHFSYTHGGFEDYFFSRSNLKTTSYTGTMEESVSLGKTRHILTDSSSRVEGINEMVSNINIRMIGDMYYQDAESDNAFVRSMSAHIAQLSSPCHNDHSFSLNDLLPTNLDDIAAKMSSITATPSDLEPMPSADSLNNLPIAMAAAASNQAKIETETMALQLKTLPLAQVESNEAQNEETARLLNEAGETDIVSQMMAYGGGLLGCFSPETKPRDSYGITSDIAFAGLEDWINGGISGDMG